MAIWHIIRKVLLIPLLWDCYDLHVLNGTIKSGA